jgi:small subunit ribosomal protein S1
MNQSGSTEIGEEDFLTLWQTYADTYGYVAPARGDLREGVVLQARPDRVIVDIGAKQEALIADRELSEMSAEERESLQPGSPVFVYILHPGDAERAPLVSLERARAYQDWVRAEELLGSGEIITLRLTGCNKGGAICEFGRLQGFIPASQIVSQPPPGAVDPSGDRLTLLVGMELPLKVIEVDRRRRRLILSERQALREWRAQQRERLFAELREGDVRRGVVSNLCDFGAFVDLGGMDGLVHISEIAWQRIRHPSQVLRVGQEVEVQVLRVDPQAQRIGLSIKRTQDDPWQTIDERYEIEGLVEGTVSHLVRFGAFVELEPGVEGLVHLSELADEEIQDPAEVVTVGQTLRLLVLNIDVERHQIGLSLRRVPGDQAIART